MATPLAICPRFEDALLQLRNVKKKVSKVSEENSFYEGFLENKYEILWMFRGKIKS